MEIGRIKVGEGEYASVYAVDKNGKKYACKVIKLTRNKSRSEIDSILKEVGAAVGFRSESGFRKAFKDQTGVAPSQWNA